ncbi:MAG: nucleotidyltransferase family protein [Candidatus Zixiibacteriota bacterium]
MSQKSKDITEIVDRLRVALPRLRRDYSVRTMGLFGSYVRGEQHRGSDLDVLVEFDEVPGLLRFMDLERELTKIAGVQVDLVQRDAMKPAIGRRILEEVRPL